MPKYNKETKPQSKPYTRSKQVIDKKKKPGLDTKKKPITKSEKLKNASITDQLDNLMDDLNSQLTRPKKKTNKTDKVLDQHRLEEEQRLYEQTQNDMDDALGLLTKL